MPEDQQRVGAGLPDGERFFPRRGCDATLDSGSPDRSASAASKAATASVWAPWPV
ncbi:hypothetical protein M8542_44105 [Amycolatopsis sp. OK19-0408]|uniref:Uncharacterized protein n=1 Tax=Amycolatopsis iheyensis TaxID=2945988 RepID=A0A9X2SQK6_9PSEU|nr:hypothetical protein [Amycolatopsis iheyensis]MCR6489818.1 hypothetical protein [Amycolatopsis iheyensis]